MLNHSGRRIAHVIAHVLTGGFSRRSQTSASSRRMADIDMTGLPSCADVLTDIVENYSAEAPFIPVKVTLCRSEDDDRGHILERSSMWAKQHHGFALDVRQWLMFSVTGVLPFWMEFRKDGPIRRVDLWQKSWENDNSFDCLYMDPISGLDTKLLIYSTRSMQRFRVIHGPQGLCVRKEVQPGAAFGRPPPVGTFEDMAQQFYQLITSVDCPI